MNFTEVMNFTDLCASSILFFAAGLEADTPIDAFLVLLAEKTGVAVGSQEILAGFPPKPLDLRSAAATSVGALGIQAGDSLTVRQIAGGEKPDIKSAPALTTTAAATDIIHQHDDDVAENFESYENPSSFSMPGMSEDEQLARAIAASLREPSPSPAHVASTSKNTATTTSRSRPTTTTNTLASLAASAPPPKGSPAFESLPDGTAVVRRIVADDNSCLFSAVGYVAQGGRSAASSLRSIVAEVVLSDPFEWNEVVLGKDPVEYATWIKDPRRWGGAIELSILSAHLKKEIAAFDIQTQRVDVYGQGKGYAERVLLLYDGLHYDALAVAAAVGAPEGKDVTSVSTVGVRTDVVMAGAQRLVATAHAQRQFTDTSNFTLRCGMCKIGLKGEKEAVAHATATGHANFTEY